MIRGMCAALALLLALPSVAMAQRADPKADTKAKADAGAKPGAGEAQSGQAGAAKKPTKRSLKAKASETSGVSPAARSLARRTKSVFIYAAESCERAGSRCDPTLRDDSQKRFMDACGACNTAARCEAERDEVLAGNARASKDPCAP